MTVEPDPSSDMSDVTVLPDGSAFFTASWPLPKDHWLYERNSDPPAPHRMGVGPERSLRAEQIRAAARYAIRGATRSGTITDFDPDAMVQSFIVGLLGFWTEDGK